MVFEVQFFYTASSFPNFDGANAFTQIQQAPGPDFRKVGKSLMFSWKKGKKSPFSVEKSSL